MIKRILLLTFLPLALALDAAGNLAKDLKNSHDVLSESDVIQARSAASQYAKDINIIQFTITVYKDQKKHDPHVWQQAVGAVSEYLTRLIAIDEQGTKNNEDSPYLEEITFAFKKMLSDLIELKKNEQENAGVDCQFNVTFGDGKQKTKGCYQGGCRCAERYAGNCPCITDRSAPQVVVVDVADLDCHSNSEESDSEESPVVID